MFPPGYPAIFSSVLEMGLTTISKTILMSECADRNNCNEKSSITENQVLLAAGKPKQVL